MCTTVYLPCYSMSRKNSTFYPGIIKVIVNQRMWIDQRNFQRMHGWKDIFWSKHQDFEYSSTCLNNVILFFIFLCNCISIYIQKDKINPKPPFSTLPYIELFGHWSYFTLWRYRWSWYILQRNKGAWLSSI